MELRVGNIEQIPCPNDFLGGDAHQTDLGRGTAKFGCPVAEKLLISLDALTLRSRRSPLKVHDTLNLNRSLVQHVHAGKLIHGDRLSLGHTRDILVISRPLEGGPLELLLDGLAVLVGRGREVDGNEGTERF